MVSVNGIMEARVSENLMRVRDEVSAQASNFIFARLLEWVGLGWLEALEVAPLRRLPCWINAAYWLLLVSQAVTDLTSGLSEHVKVTWGRGCILWVLVAKCLVRHDCPTHHHKGHFWCSIWVIWAERSLACTLSYLAISIGDLTAPSMNFIHGHFGNILVVVLIT